MSVITLDPAISGAAQRAALFAGRIVVRSQVAAVSEFVEFARREINALFDPVDPQHVHEHLSPAELASVLSAWKPVFIRHATSIELTKRIIVESGFDPEDTYFDLPKIRTAFPQGHLTTGIAYGFPWHRDSWYAAPLQQINGWFPIWEPRADNAMAFDPNGFGVHVANNSNRFDYYERNVQRADLSQLVSSDPRVQPEALGWECTSPTVLLPSPGQVLYFAGDQLHRTIPNTSGVSRFSVDFRFLSRSDIENGIGAPGVDVQCTGTAVRDFHRVSDGAEIPQSVVMLLEPNGPPPGAVLAFVPTSVDNPSLG